MFDRVLIANRGEIACRIERTLRALGVAAVAVHSDVDRHARHVLDADVAVAIGGASPADSYLRIDRVIDAALTTGADAIHPGYGLLSENPALAEACAAAGLVFIGPTPDQLRLFGQKHLARAAAEAAGLPLAPGGGLVATAAEAVATADRVGYPVMLKASSGGGGIGMRRCADAAELVAAFDAVVRSATAAFGSGEVFVERYLDRARHVEVQVFGDGAGRVVTLGERDCSAQRRNQKVIEETPAPRPARRPARRPGRRRRRPGPLGALPLGGHGGVHRRRRHPRLLLPGGQRPPAGRARRHRADPRRRPRRVDGAPRRRRRPARAGRAARRRAAGPSRRASTPRTRAPTSGRAPAC